MSFTAVAFPLTDLQLAQLPPQLISKATSAFSRNRLGKLGFGERHRFVTHGRERFSKARNRWTQLTSPNVSDLPDGLVASSPICFAAFSFDARSSTNSMITVPKFVLDISVDEIWLRYIYAPVDPVPGVEEIFTQFVNELPQEHVYESHANPVSVAAYMSEQEFCVSVNEAVAMIERGEAAKIVVARDECLFSSEGFHIASTMEALAHDNPTAWTYKVGELIGSTPELLIARQGNAAHARVLAGTVDRSTAINDRILAGRLSDNPKQLFEHQAAVESLVEKLAPFATDLQVSKKPFVLALPNVYHLATDVSAELTSSTSILDLVGEINPTAAVGGTPRKAALDAIWRLEAQTHGLDRGLYAGAVGWLDADGQGEFGIALRGCVVEDQHHIRVYAGCGIVRGSNAVEELAETHAKMRPIKQALRTRITYRTDEPTNELSKRC